MIFDFSDSGEADFDFAAAYYLESSGEEINRKFIRAVYQTAAFAAANPWAGRAENRGCRR